MVRINLINPSALADQHLVAEYDEIMMLLGYVKRFPDVKPGQIPKKYTLDKGHILFFKDKLKYLKKRHEDLKKEMRKRGFKTNITINLHNYPTKLHNDWKPKSKDYDIIKERIISKLNMKPEYYRYYGEYKSKEFLIGLIRKN